MATTAFKKLAGLLPDTYSQGRTAKVSMVVYIDEAHTLDQMGKRSGPSMFDHMLKATADLWDIPVFFLFLSTASQLEVMASRPALSNSARFRRAAKLVAPFTEMPFDCHPTLVRNPIQRRLKLEDVQKFAFIVQFGRPLSVTHFIFTHEWY